MSYRFQKLESPFAAARRILLEELDGSRVDLVTAGSDAVALHEVRKRIKRMRALLRLVADAPEFQFPMADDVLREVDRMLAAHRESDALVEILRAEARFAGSADIRLLESTVTMHQAAHGPVGDRERDLNRARRTLGGLRRVIFGIKSGELTSGACRRRFRVTYRNARRAFEVARLNTTDESLHQLRKLSKRLLNQARLIRSWAVADLSDLRKKVAELDDRLGRARDCSHLSGMLRGVPAAEAPLRYGLGLRARLQTIAEDKVARAFAIARRIFRARPKLFAARVFG
jgi:CHAD domain-containing protein